MFYQFFGNKKFFRVRPKYIVYSKQKPIPCTVSSVGSYPASSVEHFVFPVDFASQHGVTGRGTKVFTPSPPGRCREFNPGDRLVKTRTGLDVRRNPAGTTTTMKTAKAASPPCWHGRGNASPEAARQDARCKLQLGLRRQRRVRRITRKDCCGTQKAIS